MTRCQLFCFMGALLSVPIALCAQQAYTVPEVPTVMLTIDAAAEPVPALKYHLPPLYSEQVTGNAVDFYHRALLMHAQLHEKIRKQYNDRSEFWLSVPHDQFPRDEVRQWLNHHAKIFQELEKAFRRDRCDWDLGVRELRGTDVFELPLPEAQAMRDLARLLQVNARFKIAEGRLDDAFSTLRIGYQLARNCAKQPTLISALVGIAVANIMNQQLEELLAAPGAPNLYWSIASLGRPLIDIRSALEQEMAFPAQVFPFLADAETTQRTPDQWRRLLTDTLRQLKELGGADFWGIDSDWQYQTVLTILLLHGYPEAKRELIAAGFDPEQVAAMPVGQVIAIYQSRLYQFTYQELFKWHLLPYPQSAQHFEETNARIGRPEYLGLTIRGGKEILPIVSLLMPAQHAATHAPLRVERQFATLQTIEAIRMHASQHGHLPKSLDEITLVPVASDPFTGQPFVYQLRGTKAVLAMPAVVTSIRGIDRRYEITLRASTSGARP